MVGYGSWALFESAGQEFADGLPCNEGALAAVGSTSIELACAAIPQGPTAAWSLLTVTADLPASSVAAPTLGRLDRFSHQSNGGR